MSHPTNTRPSIASRLAAGLAAALLATPALAQPTNDECANPIAVGLGATAFSSAGATSSLPLTCSFNDSNDVWFAFTNGPCPTTLELSTDVLDFDPTMAVYTECGGGWLACGDDEAGGVSLNPRIEVNVAAMETVLIRVAGYDGSTGTGDLLITDLTPDQDTDGDGVCDAADSCPTVPNVTNVTRGTIHATLTEAIAAAGPADTLHLGPCVFYDRGFVLNGKSLTIIGHGPGQTIIDGQGADERMFELNSDQSTFEGITFQNARATNHEGGAALEIFSAGAGTRVIDCHFIGCGSTDGDHGAIALWGGNQHIERCVFRDNIAGTIFDGVAIGSTVGNPGHATVVNCLFDGGIGGEAMILANQVHYRIDVINCTFVNYTEGDAYIRSSGGISGIRPTIASYNSVYGTGASPFSTEFGGGTPLSNNVYWNNNGEPELRGYPTFIDAANGDYRLAPGSLGIDAADSNRFIATGALPIDLGFANRTQDAEGTANIGAGLLTTLDCGAYELQTTPAASTGACCLAGGVCAVTTEADCLASAGFYQDDDTDCGSVICSGCIGDINGDGATDVFDFADFAADFGCVTP